MLRVFAESFPIKVMIDKRYRDVRMTEVITIHAGPAINVSIIASCTLITTVGRDKISSNLKNMNDKTYPNCLDQMSMPHRCADPCTL